MSKIIQNLIRYIKKDKNYSVSTDYSLLYVLVIIFEKFFDIIRGIKYYPFIHTKKLLFVGRHSHIRFPWNIYCDGPLLIGDNVCIDALADNNIIFGANVSIGQGTIIQSTGIVARRGFGLRVGNNTGIGPISYLAAQGGIQIGNDVIMGPGVKIFSENHKYSDMSINIRLQGEERKSVRIGNNCWIGSSVTILAGVCIGNGCVIAAGAVVTKDIEDNSVVMGVPGKIIKKRDSSSFLLDT